MNAFDLPKINQRGVQWERPAVYCNRLICFFFDKYRTEFQIFFLWDIFECHISECS